MASIHFYRSYLKYKNNVTNFDFVDLIDNIWNNHTARQRTLKIDKRWYSMSAYERPRENDQINHRIRFFWIDKSVDSNPWTGNLGTVNRTRVNGTLYQPATCLLVPDSHSLIVYQPQGSPSKSQIEKYLKSFIFPTIDDEDLSIILRSVTTDLTFNQLTELAEIKRITLTVNTGNFTNLGDIFDGFEELDDGSKRILESVLNIARNVGEISDDEEDPSLTIEIKKRAYKDPVNFLLTNFLRRGINNQNGSIISASILVRLPGRDKDDIIKFGKNNDLLKPFPTDETVTGYEALFQIMREMYERREFNNEHVLDIGVLPTMDNIGAESFEFITEPEGVLSEEEFDRINERR